MAWKLRIRSVVSLAPPARASSKRRRIPARPEARGVTRREIVEAAAGAELVEGVVVQGGAHGVVVGAHDEPLGGVDHVGHLGRRQDLVRDDLVRLRMLDGEPLVVEDVGAVTDEEGRHAAVGGVEVLKVLADRHGPAREVGDVAGGVGVGEVLGAEVEVPQAPLEVR